MRLINRKATRRAGLAACLAAAMMAGACAVQPLQRIEGYITPAPTVTEAATATPEPGTPTAGPSGFPVNVENRVDGGDVGADIALPPENPSAITVFSPKTINRAEVFYPGMPSMMGFVDAPITTIYENTMEAIAASVSLRWPGAELLTYRFNTQVDKSDMLMPREQLLGTLFEPSFFREEPMNLQPPRVKPEDGLLRVRAGEPEKMNEPIISFYELTGRLIPTAQGPAAGTVVALTASDPDALTIIVSDLHELRSDDGTLIAALSQNAFQTGRSIGILAAMSEFAGYVPDIGANKTAFVWGAPPAGTLDYTLDFTDYKVGVSIDPQTRATKPRPFYVLCLGEQSAVSETLTTLSDRLAREFASNPNFIQRTALYGSNYVPDGYSLQGRMSYSGGQGVTALADPAAPGGLSRIELKTTSSQRYLEWIVEYPANPTDPRAGRFQAEDFSFEARASNDGQGISLPGLTWSIAESTPTAVRIALRLDFSSGALPRGSYTLAISGSLAAPSELPGTEWVEQFGWDPDGADMLRVEQNLMPFDGSKTLYLSRLFNALGQAHIARVGNTPLGMVEIDLAVFA
ncbi:MAG: hypothetical protein LBS11_10455 [Oscillospiraceae bacterium]|jgi:hypothetical protein|nr:hypothetical protein [Oscillospiraceae bacterium]